MYFYFVDFHIKFYQFDFLFNRLSGNHGGNAASLTIAEQYVGAFNKLARTNNTLILPSNVGDVSSLVGQAFSIYKTIDKNMNDEGKKQNDVKE